LKGHRRCGRPGAGHPADPGTFKFASAAGETTLAPNVFVSIAKDGT
jgi:hypothetical protein